MQKFRCRKCGYIYNPQMGDPKNKVEPKTFFEDLPEQWKCPSCGAEQKQFQRDEPPCIT
ncbi:MAG: rubredoxin [Dehalococcoidia bacterium]